MLKKRVIIALLLMFVILSGCSTKKKPLNDTTQTDEQKAIITGNADKDSSKYSIDELSNAILSNDKETVSKIIQSKIVDINQKNSDCKYPIEMVLVMENCEIAEMLLDAGADPQVITSDGKTVYDIAVKKDNKTLKAIFEKYK